MAERLCSPSSGGEDFVSDLRTVFNVVTRGVFQEIDNLNWIVAPPAAPRELLLAQPFDIGDRVIYRRQEPVLGALENTRPDRASRAIADSLR